MNTETRVLRPFEAVDALYDFVGRIELEVGDQTLQRDGRATLTADEYRMVPVKLVLPYSGTALGEKIGEIAEGLAPLGLDIDDLLFVVNLYTHFLRISEYPIILPMRELLDADQKISLTVGGRRPDSLRAAHHGCRVEVSIVLGEHKEFSPGRPWRKGTWLEQSTFHISTDVDFSGFTPRPMDEDQKRRLGIPVSTTRYVALPEGIDPVFDEASLEQVELWIDSELLAVIASQPSSPVSQSIQHQLFIDVCSAVSSAARGTEGFDSVDWRDASTSMIGAVIRGMAGRSTRLSEEQRSEACHRLLNILKNDHSRFMAYVEAHAGSTRAFLKSLGV